MRDTGLRLASSNDFPVVYPGMQEFESIVAQMDARAQFSFQSRFAVGGFAMFEISPRVRVLSIVTAVKFLHDKVKYDVLTVDDLHAHDLDSDRLHRLTSDEEATVATFDKLSYLRTQLKSL